MPEAITKSRTSAVNPNRAQAVARETRLVTTGIRLRGANFMADLEMNLLSVEPAPPFPYPLPSCYPTRAQIEAISKILSEWSATVQRRKYRGRRQTFMQAREGRP